MFGETIQRHHSVDVLVAIDTQDLRRSINATLCRAGYKVRLAGSAIGASLLIHESDPDVMIVDVRMRDVDVFKFVAGIRGAKTIPYFPVIFLTARADAEIRIRELGGVCVPKPVHAERLLAAVSSSTLVRHPRALLAQPMPPLVEASSDYFRRASQAQVL